MLDAARSLRAGADVRVLLFVLALCTACKSASQRESERRERARSAIAAADLAVSALAGNRVPRQFTQRVLDESARQLRDAREPREAERLDSLRRTLAR